MLQTTVPQTIPHVPNYVIPVAPGEILEEKLGEMGMSVDQLAERTGLSSEQVFLLFKGAIPLTPMVAEKLETVTKIPTNNWNRYERRYREDLKKAAEKYGL